MALLSSSCRLFLLLFVVCFKNIYAEGPLLQKNQVYTKFTVQNYSTDHVFDKKGVVQDNYNHFLQNKYLLEADYGLSNRDTLSQELGFIRVHEELDGWAQGFTDYKITLKHAFIKQRDQILTLETMFNFPLAGGYEPAVRYGDFGVGLMLFYAVQKPIYSCPFLISLGAGGMHFNNVPEDFLKLYSRFTLCPTSNFALRTTFRLDYGLNNGKHVPNMSLVDFNPNAKLLRGDFDLIIRPIPCLELTLGYFCNFWGRNVGNGGGVIGSLGYYF